jgi:hypothetical protein
MVEGKVARGDACPKCHSDARVCLNCNFFDQFAPNQCREPQAEVVRDREKANFCEFFTPSAKRGAAGQQRSKADEARSAFDNLFKKS